MSTCSGLCKGDRAAWESPAVVVQGRLACPCCKTLLTRAPDTIEVGRPPNLNPEIADTSLLFEDNVCEYNVRLFKTVVAR